MPETAERFFLDQDNSCHWYIVPLAHAKEWKAWNQLPEDDERAWQVPPFAQVIGGSPTLVTFTDPKME